MFRRSDEEGFNLSSMNKENSNLDKKDLEKKGSDLDDEDLDSKDDKKSEKGKEAIEVDSITIIMLESIKLFHGGRYFVFKKGKKEKVSKSLSDILISRGCAKRM
jgi:hypothetical protein